MTTEVRVLPYGIKQYVEDKTLEHAAHLDQVLEDTWALMDEMTRATVTRDGFEVATQIRRRWRWQWVERGRPANITKELRLKPTSLSAENIHGQRCRRGTGCRVGSTTPAVRTYAPPNLRTRGRPAMVLAHMMAVTIPA